MANCRNHGETNMFSCVTRLAVAISELQTKGGAMASLPEEDWSLELPGGNVSNSAAWHELPLATETKVKVDNVGIRYTIPYQVRSFM